MNIDKKLEQLAFNLYKEKNDEIFSFEYEKEKYWLKKARATSSNLFHKIVYKIFSYDILIPVESKIPEEAISFESNKLKLFLDNKINTPLVVLKNDNFFLMKDSGKAVYSYLKKKNIEKREFYHYLDKTIEVLSTIHNNGFYHGGAQTRNFTYINEKVYAIDLEDSFDKSKVNIETLQFRDVFLLLLSMTKVDNFDFSYSYIINKYIKETNNHDFKNKLKKISLDLSFLVSLNKINFFNKIFPRDVKGFCKLLEELKNYN